MSAWGESIREMLPALRADGHEWLAAELEGAGQRIDQAYATQAHLQRRLAGAKTEFDEWLLQCLATGGPPPAEMILERMHMAAVQKPRADQLAAANAAAVLAAAAREVCEAIEEAEALYQQAEDMLKRGDIR